MPPRHTQGNVHHQHHATNHQINISAAVIDLMKWNALYFKQDVLIFKNQRRVKW